MRKLILLGGTVAVQMMFWGNSDSLVECTRSGMWTAQSEWNGSVGSSWWMNVNGNGSGLGGLDGFFYLRRDLDTGHRSRSYGSPVHAVGTELVSRARIISYCRRKPASADM
ncbi:hypothetical protein BDW02DRAFT_432182 [Decorospora gaudefroyi]|uniref:Uncharacterized protein n=1 Tax=Decorospora gaudefroyi TaxID=184978 RepID=A0A6A5K8G6_9PLEO|nr:hypothetical protein BDW02DRAFT_432182 [Decorospora gaudefroyi]